MHKRSLNISWQDYIGREVRHFGGMSEQFFSHSYGEDGVCEEARIHINPHILF